MKKIVLLFFINLILILFQYSLLAIFLADGFYVNLYLAFVMALFMADKEEEAFLSALMGGLIIDLLSTGIIGLSSFVVTSLLLILKSTKKVFYKNWPLRITLSLIVFFIYTIVSDIQNIQKIQQVLLSCLITLGFSFIFKILLNRIFSEKRFS